MSYYKPQPLLPSLSKSNIPPRIQPVIPRPPGQQNFCSMFINMLRQNPQLMQVLRKRPDLLAMFRNRCGGFQIGAAVTADYYRRKYPRRTYPPQRPNTIPPYPQPVPPQSGCGYGKRFDSCGCRCVPKDAITPQCIRNCTQCAVDQVFNWCIMRCVPANSKIKQCPPLE